MFFLLFSYLLTVGSAIANEKNYEIIFPNKPSSAGVILVDVPFKNKTTEFSFCFRINQTAWKKAIISYAVPARDNEVTIIIMEDKSLFFVHNLMLKPSHNLKPELNTYVHYCYNFNSLNSGNVRMYMNGMLAYDIKTSLSKKDIEGNGVLVLGQDQEKGGRFHPDFSFQGSIKDVQVFDKFLSQAEVNDVEKNKLSGNIVSWIPIKCKWKLVGDAKREPEDCIKPAENKTSSVPITPSTTQPPPSTTNSPSMPANKQEGTPKEGFTTISNGIPKDLKEAHAKGNDEHSREFPKDLKEADLKDNEEHPKFYVPFIGYVIKPIRFAFPDFRPAMSRAFGWFFNFNADISIN